MEAHCMGATATNTDQGSTIVRRVKITKTTRMRSLLVEMMRRKRMILMCMVIVEP